MSIKLSKTLPLGAMAVAMLASLAATTPAAASCVYHTWVNSNPAHVIQKIKGRICSNNNIAIKATGHCQGGGSCSMGWTSASYIGNNNFVASYTGADVTNKLKFTIHTNKTMNMRIKTQYTNGVKKTWYAHFNQVN